MITNERTKNIQSIKLSTTRDSTGHIANISGWGKIIESGSTSVLLRAVDVNRCNRSKILQRQIL